MAISSPLNPGVIAPERRVTPEKAQNFISGGAPLGSSVLSAAANKIVGFQRGAAAVAPRPPDLGSIIQTLSSNILNNVESKVQTINQTVNQIVNERIADLTSGYRDKIAKVDASLPNKLLNSFLTLYNKAIGYLQFFADRKNVSRLGDNLKALQEVFNETFKVAQIIRKQIVRIVDQLSNLPTASAGGGPGLNIDVDVPGGGLRRSAPSGLMRMMRRRPGMMLAGAGALGAGGAMVTSALAGPGAVQAEPTQDSGGLTGQYLDKFNFILSKFQSAIDDLSKPRQQSGGESGGGAKTTTKPASAPPPGAPGAPGTPGAPGAPGVTTTGEKGVLDLIASVEQGPEGYDSFNQSAGKTKGKATEQTIGWLAKNAKGAIGRYQQMPQFLLERAKRAGFDANTKFTPEVQDAITLNELRKGHSLDKFLGGQITEEQFLQKLAPTWRGLPQGTINAAKLGGTADMTYQDSSAGRNAAGKTYSKTIAELKAIRGGGNKPVATAQPAKPSPGVVAAPTQQQTAQQVAQTVSQPPATVQNNIVEMLNPVNMSQSLEQGGGVQTVDSGTVQGGTVPFLVSTNEDNFLTLYSKIVYNIVDG